MIRYSIHRNGSEKNSRQEQKEQSFQRHDKDHNKVSAQIVKFQVFFTKYLHLAIEKLLESIRLSSFSVQMTLCMMMLYTIRLLIDHMFDYLLFNVLQ